MKLLLVLLAALAYVYADDDVDIRRRIVGGHVAKKNEFPYQVCADHINV